MRACALGLIAMAVALAGDEGQGGGPQKPLDPFMVSSTDATSLRVVPLRHGELPDLTQGPLLRPRCGQGVDANVPVEGVILHEGAILAIRRGREDGYSRFEHDDLGQWKEVAVGAWPQRWQLAAAADLTGDGRDELLLVLRANEQGTAPYRIKIAKARQNGTWDFERPEIEVCRTWRAFFTLGDLDDDGLADLVFHQVPHASSTSLRVEYLPGRGDGAFAPVSEKRLLLRGQHAAHNLVVADFNRDRKLDLFLPPDDDVRDFGQTHVALSSPEKPGRELRPSLDLRPEDESRGDDRGAWHVVATDVDLDGHLDVVARFRSWRGDGRYSLEVFRGRADGSFGPCEVLAEGTAIDRDQPTRWGWTSGL